MLYSSRHGAFLVRFYTEKFGPIPAEVLERACDSAARHELLDALDTALRIGMPIADWQSCETPLQRPSLHIARGEFNQRVERLETGDPLNWD